MSRGALGRALALHLAVLAVLLLAQFVLSEYQHATLARIMVLAVYALGYNVLFGYTGLMSLGHAMFFAAGMYGAGLPVYYLGLGAPAAFALGVLAALVLAVVFGLFALRTSGVAFLIVTMMFAQALYLTSLYFNEFTMGSEGFILSRHLAPIVVGGHELALSAPGVKYNLGWALFAAAVLVNLALVASPIGRVLVAIRENEDRARLIGYDTFRFKLLALAISGAIAGAAGAAYALLFAYVGSSFAATLYSIYPLLWTLLGGAGTVLGPLVGTGLMFYLIDFTSELTSSYLFFVGGALLVLVLWFPRGLVGALRARWLGWLP